MHRGRLPCVSSEETDRHRQSRRDGVCSCTAPPAADGSESKGVLSLPLVKVAHSFLPSHPTLSHEIFFECISDLFGLSSMTSGK